MKNLLKIIGVMENNFSFKKAKWIWLKDKKINQYADFTAKVDFFGENAQLYISVMTDYVLFINGDFVDCGQYGDFPELKSVDKIDITDHLVQGVNKIDFIARSMDSDSFIHIKNGHGIIFEVVVDDKVVLYSDENILSRENALYQSGKTYEITPQISFGYHCDLNNQNQNEYQKSQVVSCNAGYFLRPIKKLKFYPVKDAKILASGSYILGDAEDYSNKLHTAFLSFSQGGNKNIIKKTSGDGVYFIVDLCKERSGFLDFELKLSNDAEIIVTFGEHLADLRVRNHIAEMDFVLYHHGKKGTNAFTSYLRRIGARYLQFFVSADEVEVVRASLIETVYPVEEKQVKFDDFFMQSIWDVSVRTLRLCMHEHYEDCPWREQAQYGTDGFLQILSGFYAFKTQEFARESLLLMGYEVNEHGLLCLTSPSRQELFIPSFSMSYIQAVYEYYERTKDVDFVKKSVPTVEKLIDTFISHIDETGLIKRFDAWNFYEWTEELCHFEEESYHAPINAMLFAALDSWQKVIANAGLSSKNLEYQRVKERLKVAINETFWDKEKNMFSTYLVKGKQYHYAEYTQAVLLWAGCLDNERKERLSEILMNEDNNLIKLSLSNNYFKYEGLLRSDVKNLDYIIKDIKRRWGKMLFSGATSFWETEEGEQAFSTAGSLCHGWSAIPAYIFGRYLIKQNCFFKQGEY